MSLLIGFTKNDKKNVNGTLYFKNPGESLLKIADYFTLSSSFPLFQRKGIARGHVYVKNTRNATKFLKSDFLFKNPVRWF